MNSSTAIVLSASFFILLAGAYAWWLTRNYFLLVNTTLVSFSLLFAAQQLDLHSPVAVLVSLFCTMLLGGRFLGTWLRLRRERAVSLGLPAQLVGVTAALALVATVTAYCAVFRGA